jgi:hypothetical protein
MPFQNFPLHHQEIEYVFHTFEPQQAFATASTQEDNRSEGVIKINRHFMACIQFLGHIVKIHLLHFLSSN